MSNLPAATTDNFDLEVLKAKTAILVDFWAEWCGPCRQLMPIVEQIAQETPSLKVMGLNVDENPEIAGKYSVVSIPTLIVFKNGEVAKRITGAKPKAVLLQELADFI